MHHRGATARTGQQLAPALKHLLFETPLSVFSLGRFRAWDGPCWEQKLLKIALGTLLGRSWLFLACLGRLLASLGVSLAYRERFWSHFGMIFDDFSKRRGGCCFTCFSFVFLCAGALKSRFFGSICVFVCCVGSLFDPLVPFSRRPRRVCEH